MIEVEVEDPAWKEALPDPAAVAVRAAEAALIRPLRDGSPASPGNTGVVILLTSDEEVRGLNLTFRAKDQPTNVLSFPAAENPEGHLGDIALAFGVCAREAVEQGKPLAHHLSHLVAHGVLHLLGYDHESEDEAQVMEAAERAILKPLGVPDPYQAEGA